MASDSRTTDNRPRTDQGSDRDERDRDRHPKGKSKPRKGLLRRLWYDFERDDVLTMGGGLAYFAFLSFPPLVLVVFALTGYFGGEELAVTITDWLIEILPDEGEELVANFVQQVVQTEAPGPLSIGLILYLWAASNVFVALTRSLNIAYDVREERSFVRQRALAIAVMFLFLALFLSGALALLVGPYIVDAIDLAGAARVAWDILQWPLAFMLVVAAFWIAYYLLPARDQSRGKLEILKGAAAAAVVWLVATLGFRIYIGNFANYTESYGILGGVIVFMFWLYISSIVMIMGGELAAELEEMSRDRGGRHGEEARA